MELEEKQKTYEECVNRIIVNKKAILKCAWEIGLDLRTIQQRELYLLDCRDFKEFLKDRVSLGRSTAYFLIDIVTTYEKTDFEKWGFKKLVMIKGEIEEEKPRNKFIKSEPVYSVRQLSEEITRFKSQAGIQTANNQETELKLIRQYSKIEAFLTSLIGSLANWIAEGRKHTQNEEIRGLLVKADELQRRLK